jgi:hypothetical protein
MADLFTAKRCFEENLAYYRSIAHASAHPEQHNLYQGLSILAEALAEVQSQLTDIQEQLRARGKKG